MSKSHFTSGMATTKGSKHNVNEDSVIALTWSDIPRFTGEEAGLFIMADGMVMPDSGIGASQLAIQIVVQEIKAAIFQINDVTISQIMIAAVQKANLQVIAEVPQDGTTITAALLLGNQVHIAHVGDSRLYSFEGQTLAQMISDHAKIQRVVSAGPLNADFEDFPIRKVLYRALGQTETIEVDFRSEQVTPNTQLLLCTDGLISLDSPLTEADLLPIISKNEPQKACDQLIELAQKSGSTDDISVIVIQINSQ